MVQYQQGDIHSQQMLVSDILLGSDTLRLELCQICLRVSTLPIQDMHIPLSSARAVVLMVAGLAPHFVFDSFLRKLFRADVLHFSLYMRSL